MRLVGEIHEDRTDRLQAEETRDVVRVELVPLIQQASIVLARHGENHAKLRLFDLRRQRSVAVLLTEKDLGETRVDVIHKNETRPYHKVRSDGDTLTVVDFLHA